MKKSSQDNITLERIRNAFLEPKTMQKEFLSKKPDEQRNTLITLLWNASVSNKKIANISFKEPHNILSKIENKSDFNSVRRGRDFRLIRSPSLAHSLSRDCVKHPPDA